mmetsp:Transcript_16160/g.40960  ORF Transcript_16160/g.40960 Transcript_16160/m.40960 type:complete len:187 (+) Transcript_16160:94-654(+)
MPQDTALHKAANQGDVEACKDILEKGEIDINAPGAAERTALQRAVGGNHLELAQVLIDMGADVNKTDKAGRTALHWAAIGGHHEPVKLLLEKNVNINAQTSSGMTALHGVVEGNRLEVANVLIGYHEKVVAGEAQGTKIDFSLKDSDGKTAFDIAKEKKLPELAKMIKEERLLKPGESASGGCVIS